MRILAIAASFIGHIDFGGGGFVRLATVLRNRGHEVSWLTYGAARKQLVSLGWKVYEEPGLKAMYNVGLSDLPALTNACRGLDRWLCELRPDLLLVDRLMTVCGFVAEALEIPFVALGTPGGYWIADKDGVHPSTTRPPALGQLAAALCQCLGWKKGELHSRWVRSHLLNITFMGRSFYPDTIEAPHRVAWVNLFAAPVQSLPPGERALGLVLGNTGNLSHMSFAIETLEKAGLINREQRIDVLAGGRTVKYEVRRLLAQLASYPVHEYGWVDYAEAFSRMERVISFGGISTIWHAVNHSLPMLIVDGMVGDQRWNGMRVARLGLGGFVSRLTNREALPADYARLLLDTNTSRALATFRDRQNFTDTLDSVATRIERFMGS